MVVSRAVCTERCAAHRGSDVTYHPLSLTATLSLPPYGQRNRKSYSLLQSLNCWWNEEEVRVDLTAAAVLLSAAGRPSPAGAAWHRAASPVTV